MLLLSFSLYPHPLWLKPQKTPAKRAAGPQTVLLQLRWTPMAMGEFLLPSGNAGPKLSRGWIQTTMDISLGMN